MTPEDLADLNSNATLRKRMKELMIEVVNRTYLYVSAIFASSASPEIIEH
jgi:hypothetical protein